MDLRSIINTETADNQVQKASAPITPIQAGPPQQTFREYHPPQSVGKHPSQDYGQSVSDTYTSPISYQGAYPGRPSGPPPLQPPAHNDPRSPAGSYSAQSPYARNTPTSSVSGSYPFPPNQAPQSPAQPHPYSYPAQHRDSYPPAFPPQTQHQHHQNYAQANSIPNTPVTTPGGANAYFPHQRTQSSHSNSTPTSAHSQQQYYNQYPPESPVSAGPFLQGQVPQQQHQLSQPQTPLGPPLSNQRQNSVPYQQPVSPYQQRPRSSGAINTSQQLPHGPAQNQSLQHQIHRQPSTPTTQNSRQTSTSDSTLRSLSFKRDRSLSVSPKTQPPPLPRANMAASQAQPVQDRQVETPKRKREMSETVSPHIANDSQSANSLTSSPKHPVKKRRRYVETPIWAQNFVEVTKAKERASRHGDGINGNHVGPGAYRPEFKGGGPLGSWEPSITGLRPFEELPKLVADWLFRNVVTRADAGELSSRGVDIEIEAKLGKLVDKETNERVRFPVISETILEENTKRFNFQSTMTEAQHKSLNDFLNNLVAETHPGNPNKTKPRVPIVYLHRRECDRFYELPPAAHAALPASLRKELNPRHTVKVRVSHDQKTGRLLAKIIKSRVADLDIYFPNALVDCRISINLEMQYDGDLEGLIGSSGSSRVPDRNKDRLSYTQSHYQIDLTQITDGDSREKEHELEIEVSTAAVREQGGRALSNQPHQYGELIEGFVDNIRVLSRRLTTHSTN